MRSANIVWKPHGRCPVLFPAIRIGPVERFFTTIAVFSSPPLQRRCFVPSAASVASTAGMAQAGCGEFAAASTFSPVAPDYAVDDAILNSLLMGKRWISGV